MWPAYVDHLLAIHLNAKRLPTMIKKIKILQMPYICHIVHLFLTTYLIMHFFLPIFVPPFVQPTILVNFVNTVIFVSSVSVISVVLHYV